MAVVNDSTTAFGCHASAAGEIVFNNHSLPMPAGRATGVIGAAGRSGSAGAGASAEILTHICRDVSRALDILAQRINAITLAKGRKGGSWERQRR